MNKVLRVIFLGFIMASGLAYLFSNTNALETESSAPAASQHKVSKVEVPMTPPKAPPRPKKVRKTESLEKPSAISSTPFSGLKAFGSSGSGSGMISQADQQASASGSFSDSKSSQTSDVQILSKTDPQFPDAAKKKNITGYVRVQITIDQSSAIKSIDVIEANPEGYFESSAVESVKNWKFSAAYQNGTPVESTIKRRIEFKLE
mgnify:CR=1 FL=1|tara:strand:+ start:12427 stop:13038 length:612 start_codon:yes stop_codon:yes gene_type:complete